MKAPQIKVCGAFLFSDCTTLLYYSINAILRYLDAHFFACLSASCWATSNANFRTFAASVKATGSFVPPPFVLEADGCEWLLHLLSLNFRKLPKDLIKSIQVYL